MIEEYNDYELVYLAQEYNEDALDILNKKYIPLINMMSKTNYLFLKNKGLELSDIKQECLIAFNDAIHSFNDKEKATFSTFARNCLKKKLISINRKYGAGKNEILNEALSLDYIEEESEDNKLLNIIKSNLITPETNIEIEESVNQTLKKVSKKLSTLEETVIKLKTQNYNYKEIASILDKDEKSIYNATRRIKQKLQNSKKIN